MYLKKKIYFLLAQVASASLLSVIFINAHSNETLTTRTQKIELSEKEPTRTIAENLLWLNQTYNPTVKYSVACSIYIVHRSILSIKITELSTYKVNACDPDLFMATTSASVSAQLLTYTDIDRVVPAGPYVQMMDRNTSTVAFPYLSIGLLKFSEKASASLGPIDILQDIKMWWKWKFSQISYNPLKMQEDINYVWLPGSNIFTLTSDTGTVFIMTSFIPDAMAMQSKTIEESATNLSQYLNLPPGWKYESKKLKKVLSVKRQQNLGHTSLRIQDEYGNNYLAIDEKIE
jgi:hypothetical protein